MAEGVAAHRAALARRLDTPVVVQFDEPSLPAALGGRLTGVTALSPVAPLDETVAEALLDTCIAAVDADGCLVGVGAARDDASVLAALRPYVVGDCLVAVDAPLVVANRTGQRPAEAALNRDFRQFEAGAYPANTEKPEFADVPRAARLARQLALDMDPLSS
ncbi:DUF429 domain-containing protein, partial [Klebsiella pneumoniae]